MAYNPTIGRIKTDAGTLAVDRAFIAHFAVEDLEAAATDSIVEKKNLAAAAQTGVTILGGAPDTARNVQIKGSAAQLTTGSIKVYGRNGKGIAIDETIDMNGTSAVAGTKAFSIVTKVDYPAEVNTGVTQKTTTAVTAATGAGTATLSLTAVCLGDLSPYEFDVVFAAGDIETTTTAAAQIIETINADTVLSTYVTASGSTANMVLELVTQDAQDATVSLAVDAAGDTGLTLGATTVNTRNGVCDSVQIGWGKVIGIPYLLSSTELVLKKLFNNAADSGTVSVSTTAIESNTLAVNGAPDGAKNLDLYILV